MAQRKRKPSARETARAQARKVVDTSKRLGTSVGKKAKDTATRVTAGSGRKKSGAKDTSKKLRTYSNLSGKRKGKKDAKSRKRAERLAALPKSRWKRWLYYLQPKHFAEYWFNREGAIRALKIAGISFAALIVFSLGVFAWFRKDLPDPRDIRGGLLQSTKFYDRTGQHLLYEVYGDQNRTSVEFEDISDYAKWATVAIEDKDFYTHGGFSLTGIIRAGWNNLFGSGTQGGSTLTQQFIKNAVPEVGNERTVTRKIKEVIMSIELERLYSKDEILTFYLNEIPYGAQEYGIEAAANSYFDKASKELTIDEAALLASMPQAPTFYSPYGENTDDLTGRQHFIIDLMQEQNYISQEEADAAKEVDTLAKIVPIENRSLYRNITAPHFVLHIQELLEEEYGANLVQTGGLTVITTLDLDLQRIAEESVANNIDSVVNPVTGGSGDNVALVSEDVPTGQVLAYVGSRDFNFPEYGAFDAANPRLGRQPGSSFKPFSYAELFKNEQWGPGSIIYDTPTNFFNYKPNNFDFSFPGPMKVRDALGRSRNIPAVKSLYIAGVENTINLSKAMGNQTLGDASQYGLSLVLGAGEVKLAEHTHAYGTFARQGKFKEQAYVLRVENADGEVLEEWNDSEGEQVLDEQLAYLVTDILKDDVARAGTFGRNNPRLVVPGINHTVKTGTTDLSVDGWMMGYSTCTATGVWVGNHDSRPMNSITSWQTGPAWTEFMRRAHENRGCGTDEFARPEGIKDVRIDTQTGYPANDRSTQTHTDIAASWFDPPEASEATKFTIDIVSKKRATDCTPPRARQEQTSSGKLPEVPRDDPAFPLWAPSAGYSSSGGGPTEDDDVHSCSDSPPNISIDTDKIDDGIYEIEATVSRGTHPIGSSEIPGSLNFKVNGQVVSAQNINSAGSYSYTHVFGSSGSFNVAVEIIDSALYDNSNSDTLNGVSAADTSISFNSPPTPSQGSTVSSGNKTIDWDNVSGADQYEICYTVNGGGNQCQTKNGSNFSLNTSGNNTYAFTIRAYVNSTLIGSGTRSFSTS